MLKLSLSQAAQLITELSGYQINRHGVWYRRHALNAVFEAGRWIVYQDKAISFASTYTGAARGFKAGLKQSS